MRALALEAIKAQLCVWVVSTPHDAFIQVGTFTDYLAEWQKANTADHLYTSPFIYTVGHHGSAPDLIRHDAAPQYEPASGMYMAADPFDGELIRLYRDTTATI